MKKSRILVPLLLILFSFKSKVEECTDQTHKDNDETVISWINNKVDSVMKRHHIPAISVGIIKDGEVLFSEGFGVRNRSSNKAVDVKSIYQIGSDTKKMTGIIVKSLILEQQLSLNDPIAMYLPKTIAQKYSHITIKDLLLHKSGLPYRAPSNKRVDGEPMLIPYTEEDLLSDLTNIEINSEKQFLYSNLGYGLIGYICEKASNSSYSDLIEKYISSRHQLPNTTIKPTKMQLEYLVTPYRKENRFTETEPFTMGKLSSAGGVYSNVEDMLKLMAKQIQAYKESYSLNHVLVLTDNTDSSIYQYGFGLSKRVFKGGTQYGHGGDLDGYASAYSFSPDFNAGVVILTSSGGSWVGELEKELFYKFTNREYHAPKESIAQLFYNFILHENFHAGREWLEKHKNSNSYYLKEEEMNNVGYALLGSARNEEALNTFNIYRLLAFQHDVA